MPGATIFRAARVWDGAAASPLVDGFVLVDDDRIGAVGRWAELEDSTSRGAALGAVPIVDCGDATLLPGLINAHVHLTLSGSMTVLDDYLADRDAGTDTLTARAIANLRAGMATGTTTVRDCGTVNDVAFAARMPLGLDVYFNRPGFLELFVELIPGLFIYPGLGLDFDFDLGVRFFF